MFERLTLDSKDTHSNKDGPLFGFNMENHRDRSHGVLGNWMPQIIILFLILTRFHQSSVVLMLIRLLSWNLFYIFL
jgi:hypothetical protein